MSGCLRAPLQAAGICYGGMARMATYIKSVRATADTTLLLDAGDTSVGTVWDAAFADRRPLATLQNLLGVSAFVSRWIIQGRTHGLC